MTQIEIEKNIPLPIVGSESKYPWASMEIGDSFFSSAKRGSLAASASYQTAKRGWRFTIRTEGEGNRIWRVA